MRSTHSNCSNIEMNDDTGTWTCGDWLMLFKVVLVDLNFTYVKRIVVWVLVHLFALIQGMNNVWMKYGDLKTSCAIHTSTNTTSHTQH
jgi:hypothetical protein